MSNLLDGLGASGISSPDISAIICCALIKSNLLRARSKLLADRRESVLCQSVIKVRVLITYDKLLNSGVNCLVALNNFDSIFLMGTRALVTPFPLAYDMSYNILIFRNR
jgi:hypothetical protein